MDKGRGGYWAFGVGHEIPLRSAAIPLAAKLYVLDHYYDLTGISAVETRAGIQRAGGSVTWEASLVRLWTWENGDFRATEAVAPG